MTALYFIQYNCGDREQSKLKFDRQSVYLLQSIIKLLSICDPSVDRTKSMFCVFGEKCSDSCLGALYLEQRIP
jgi:hypothetical protein